jgi:hypothetical protein
MGLINNRITRKATEEFWRIEIAKEIQSFTLNWHQFADGIPLHQNCYNCNAEARTPVCDTSRIQWAKSVYTHMATNIRGN